MAEKKRIDEGYQPVTQQKGYQPKKPASGEVTGGYQPTTSEGDNPANKPSKPPPKKP